MPLLNYSLSTTNKRQIAVILNTKKKVETIESQFTINNKKT